MLNSYSGSSKNPVPRQFRKPPNNAPNYGYRTLSQVGPVSEYAFLLGVASHMNNAGKDKPQPQFTYSS